MKGIKKGLAILLVLCTLLSMVVMTGAGAAPQSADAPEAQTMAANDGFMKMVLLDGGRGHISVENVKAVINEMALYDYDYLMLGIGNDGLRFLLDDMSVEANGQNYDSDKIKDAIIEKNNELAPKARGEWSETDMNTILAYAREKGISIVPMLNTPGHATSIVAAMTACGITNCSLASSGTDTKNITINIENEQAAAFAKALVKKYITWFSSRGCTYFNLGCDEYGGNAGNTQDKTNQAITAYVTDLCNAMTAMTPMAFTDVLCACSNVPDNLVGIHWYKNKLQNNSNVRANSNWYYVLGKSGSGADDDWATYEKALKKTATDLVDANYAGSLLAIWNDNNQPFSPEELTRVDTLIRTQATSNPMYFTPQVENPNPTPEEPTNTRNIWVPVGGTTKDTIEGGDFSGQVDKTKLDTSIAIVSAEKTPIQGTTTYTRGDKVTSITSDGQYIIVNSRSGLTLQNETSGNGLLLSNANTPTVWTIAKAGSYYYVQNGNRYLSVGNESASAGSQNRLYLEYNSGNGGFWDIRTESKITTGWFSSNYFYLNQYGGSDSPMAAGYTKSGSDDEGSRWEIYKAVEQTSEAGSVTDVTFNGVKEGITYATVGDVHYTIHVVPQAVANVTLTYHPWISSFAVYPEGYEGSYPEEGEAHDVKLQAMYAYSKEGVAFSDLVAPTGDWHWEEDAQTVYWKGTILSNGNHQDTKPIKDKSMAGTDFTYIRYWDGVWSYSSDQVTWTKIKDTDEVCAYYLQQTAVTKEVDTYVKDWAFTAANANTKHDRPAQKALSFAVVYPGDRETKPNEDQIYQKSTLVYWDNTDFTFIRIQPNENYEIEKITYTMGKRTSGTSGSWNPSETIEWEKKTVPGTTTDQWYDETICWDESYDTEPVVNSASVPNITDKTWGADDAVLILIYLKTVVKEDSLIVKYWDDASNAEITKYAIQTSHESTAEEKTFWNSLEPGYKYDQADTVYSDGLKPNAYVTNLNNVNEYIQQDLTKVSSVYGKYTSGLYNYVGAEISQDGKTLTLHYNLNREALQPYYVADFGLPVEISFNDLGKDVKTASVSQPSNGTAKVENGKIIYQPSRAYSGPVVLSVTATFEVGEPQLYNVGIYPATTVYYEETFMEGGTIGTQPAQQSLAYGNNSDHTGKYNYGYDAAYAGQTGDSNGTVAELKTGAQGTFTFTGTGVDVYARTMKESGKVMVYVYDGSGDGKVLKRLVTVDTRQLGDQSANDTAYNVPIVSLSGLSAGEHTIRMLAVQTKDQDGVKQSWPVYIDGFRVHGTLDVNSEVYHPDGEANPTFVELRNSVLNAVIGDTKPDSIYADQIANETMSQVYAANEEGVSALIVTRDSTMTDVEVKDLLDNGPKNEIYLKQGEALVFTVNAASAQIGLKALNKATSYKINSGEPVSLSTSTDMFYPVNTSMITITNTGDGILSVTELKLFGADTSTATVEPMSAPALTRALVSLGFESEPVAATATLNITVQCGDKAVPVTLTHDGMSNETYTFTAAEIKAAVEQALPEGYTVADVTFSDVTVACGEASDVAFTAAETPAPAGLLQKIVQIAVKIVKKIFSWF